MKKNQPQKEKPKKENILDLEKYRNKQVIVESGSRTVVGKLVGFDQLQNLVLDQAREQGWHDRELGLLVIRGTSITSFSPFEGFEEIDNPF
ncbi:hypothetical protein EDD86DRAFT_199993 [Gorgonomyces haynaldii]|nr:hypothetical protein EDD86DRAFT_199993 [Gorgonomyces haynaldii]